MGAPSPAGLTLTNDDKVREVRGLADSPLVSPRAHTAAIWLIREIRYGLRAAASAGAVFSALAILVFAAAGCSAGSSKVLPSLGSPIRPAPSIDRAPGIQGPISAPGGPYLYDQRDASCSSTG